MKIAGEGEFPHSETIGKRTKEPHQFRIRSHNYVQANGQLFAETHPVEAAILEKREIAKTLSKWLNWTGEYLDKKTFLKKLEVASVKDIMVTAAVLTDKILVTTDQPTNIISNQERKQLDELGPALLKELARRGKTVTLTERTAEIACPEATPLPVDN